MELCEEADNPTSQPSQAQILSATSSIRQICEKVQNKFAQHLELFQLENLDLGSNATETVTVTKQKFQSLKNDLVRVLSSGLPDIISKSFPISLECQSKANDQIEDLKETVEDLERKLLEAQQKVKSLILQKDGLQAQVLSLSQKKDQGQQQFQTVLRKTEQLTVEVGILREKLKNDQQKNIHEEETENEDRIQEQKESVSSQKQRGFDYPLQIKQKLTEAQTILSRTPHSKKPELQASHYQMGSEIVNCQKQILEYELRESEKEIQSLKLKLQQEEQYSLSLEKEVKEGERILEGEKKRLEQFDRELYDLSNTNKAMKLDLLEAKAQLSSKDEEIQEYEDLISQKEAEISEQRKQLESCIQSLDLNEKLKEQMDGLKLNLEMSEAKYQELRRVKGELERQLQAINSQLCHVKEQLRQKSHQMQSLQKTQDEKIDLLQVQAQKETNKRVKDIENMSKTIKEKYQQKLEILQKSLNNYKQKVKALKQQNDRLYEAMDICAKKQAVTETKYSRDKQKLIETQRKLAETSKDYELILEKTKTNTMVNKQFKRQIMKLQKQKETSDAFLRKMKSQFIPEVQFSLKFYRSQIVKIKKLLSETQSGYQQFIQDELTRFFKVSDRVVGQEKEQIGNLMQQVIKKQTLIQHFQKQFKTAEDHRLRLIEKLNSYEKQSSGLQNKIKQQEQTIERKCIEIEGMQHQKQRMEKQIERHKKMEKQSTNEIELLREKYSEVQKFQTLIDQLTSENIKLRQIVKEKSLESLQNLVKAAEQKNRNGSRTVPKLGAIHSNGSKFGFEKGQTITFRQADAQENVDHFDNLKGVNLSRQILKESNNNNSRSCRHLHIPGHHSRKKHHQSTKNITQPNATSLLVTEEELNRQKQSRNLRHHQSVRTFNDPNFRYLAIQGKSSQSSRVHGILTSERSQRERSKPQVTTTAHQSHRRMLLHNFREQHSRLQGVEAQYYRMIREGQEGLTDYVSH